MNINNINLNPKLKIIKQKKYEIETAQEFIRNMKQEIAEERCPFSVGDKVFCEVERHGIVSSIYYIKRGCGYGLLISRKGNNGKAMWSTVTKANHCDKYKKVDNF